MSHTLTTTLLLGTAVVTAMQARQPATSGPTPIEANPQPAPEDTPPAGSKPLRVSAACARGKHNRCHGTVYVWPPNKEQRFADCECPDKDCWHHNKERPLPHH